MIKLLADENFNNIIFRGVLQRLPDLDFVRIQDVGLRTKGDPQILAFAASERRIVVSHDVRTMETFALSRLDAGFPMTGVFLIPRHTPFAEAIESLVVVAECSHQDEWTGLVQFLPL